VRPWVDDGAMSRTKSIRKLSVEMREAQLEKERRTAPQRARLKVETTLAVAAFNGAVNSSRCSVVPVCPFKASAQIHWGSASDLC